jgi:ABC-2 type transport system permease protein
MVAAFLALGVLATAIFISYAVIANSLAFWLGNASALTNQLQGTLILFSTYPSALFSGPVRVLLYTAIPAGFVAYVPVRLLREWDWTLAAGLGAVAVGSVALASGVFYRGLRRYESGNLLAMRA